MQFIFLYNFNFYLCLITHNLMFEIKKTLFLICFTNFINKVFLILILLYLIKSKIIKYLNNYKIICKSLPTIFIAKIELFVGLKVNFLLSHSPTNVILSCSCTRCKLGVLTTIE